MTDADKTGWIIALILTLLFTIVMIIKLKRDFYD